MNLNRILILLPHAKPVGGVLKMLDYARHSVSLGIPTRVFFRAASSNGIALTFPQFDELHSSPLFTYEFGSNFHPSENELLLFSLPTDFEAIREHLGSSISIKQVVHLIQNTRHANSGWLNGYPRRLLRRSLGRICINQVVKDEIRPFVPANSILEVNSLSHDLTFFSERPTINRLVAGSDSPIHVGYTTWKSKLGDAVRDHFDLAGFEFRSIDGVVDWFTLRDLYFWSDIFLAFPNEEEGMYLAGLEAMAADCLLITPMVKGNSLYAIPGVNCVESAYEQLGSYVSAIQNVAGMSRPAIVNLFEEARKMASSFGLAHERQGFKEFLLEYFPSVIGSG